jgi:hypothetical protein
MHSHTVHINNVFITHIHLNVMSLGGGEGGEIFVKLRQISQISEHIYAHKFMF